MIVTITVEKRESVVLLPMTAVQRGENADDFTVYVVVDENGRCVARKRSVKLDGVCDNRIRLIEGPGSDVSLGDRIVSGGAFRVCDGQVVRMLDVPDRATQFDEP
jgi:multidrug efflux pump subunit AcrA (membrane-fusion protein)